MTNIDIAKHLLKALAKDESIIEYVDDRLGHDFRYAIDSSRAAKELGWEAETSFEKGLADTIAWYKANEVWWKPLLREILLNKIY